MKGSPKYKVGDEVVFRLEGEDIAGRVYIVDAYGTFEDDSDVSYDILEMEGEVRKCLYKHVREDMIIV